MQGLEPRLPGPKPGALTLTLHPGAEGRSAAESYQGHSPPGGIRTRDRPLVETVGIEPTTTTLARRVRSLTCSPHAAGMAPGRRAHAIEMSICLHVHPSL